MKKKKNYFNVFPQKWSRLHAGFLLKSIKLSEVQLILFLLKLLSYKRHFLHV